MDYFKNRKYEIIRMIFLIISGAIGHSKNDLFSYRISLQYYIKCYTSSPWQDILKSLGNSDLNFPTSGPWLPRCKYESIQLDLTLYMILHCCSLVYAGCCGLYMQLYVQIPCCSFVYAGCSSLWLRQYTNSSAQILIFYMYHGLDMYILFESHDDKGLKLNIVKYIMKCKNLVIP